MTPDAPVEKPRRRKFYRVAVPKPLNKKELHDFRLLCDELDYDPAQSMVVHRMEVENQIAELEDSLQRHSGQPPTGPVRARWEDSAKGGTVESTTADGGLNDRIRLLVDMKDRALDIDKELMNYAYPKQTASRVESSGKLELNDQRPTTPEEIRARIAELTAEMANDAIPDA